MLPTKNWPQKWARCICVRRELALRVATREQPQDG